MRNVTTIATTKDGSNTKDKTTLVQSTDGYSNVRVTSTIPTSNGKCEVVDSRTLQGHMVHQTLQITNLSTGRMCTTQRFFTPCEPPVEEEPEPVEEEPFE
jgi:hypothetical protein